MSERTYYFVIAIPKEQMIEYTTKLNSYISKLFQKAYPCTLKPLEMREQDVLSKITIKATEEDIREFADRFFDKKYELAERDNGEIEITQKEPNLPQSADDQSLKH